MNKLNNIEDIVKNMTLEEKARLVNGATFFGSAGIDRLGVPRMQLLDGGTGVNFEQLFGDFTQVFSYSEDNMIGSSPLVNVIESFYNKDNLKEENVPLYDWVKEKLESRLMDTIGTTDYAPACFPPGILLGSTWNEDTVNKVGKALGMEACVFGVNMLLGTPNVNIHRDPLNGRLFEGYSEDPFLVSKLAPELVKGVQEYGVIANVKHFAANNQETNRVGIDETISRRALEEIYLPGFKACVTEGNVKTVMSAYNKINGIPCTENQWLLKEKLIEEWGFDGFVVSDWGAVANPVKALAGGNDLVMPGPHEWQSVYDGVNDGEIAESVIDEAVYKILKVIQWLTENYKDNIKSEHTVDYIREFTNQAAYEAAVEGIVMLKNNGTYPLKQGQKIILAGSGAGKLLECGSGSAGIHTDRVGDLSKELADIYGADNVYVAEDVACIKSIVESFKQDNVSIIFVCSLGGMEGNDRKDMNLLEEDLSLLEDCPYNKSVILNTCGPVDMSFDNDSIDAIWAMFLPGMGGAKAMAHIISGKANPSGKLPITFPGHYEDTPTYLNFPGDGWKVNYGEGIYVGYRYYDKKCVEPKYSFGYGLSYTSFEAKVMDYSENFEDKCTVKVAVTNTGDVAGSEVVQLYISDIYSTISKPVKELKAFRKIYLEAGETKEYTFILDKSAFASYDGDINMWISEEGYYNIYVASSSSKKDIYDKVTVYLDAKSPYSYGINSQIKVLYENTELKKLTFDLWSEYGFDVEALNNNYQYTSHRALKDILWEVSDKLADEEKKKEFVSRFDEMVAAIKKN